MHSFLSLFSLILSCSLSFFSLSRFCLDLAQLYTFIFIIPYKCTVLWPMHLALWYVCVYFQMKTHKISKLIYYHFMLFFTIRRCRGAFCCAVFIYIFFFFWFLHFVFAFDSVRCSLNFLTSVCMNLFILMCFAVVVVSFFFDSRVSANCMCMRENDFLTFVYPLMQFELSRDLTTNYNWCAVCVRVRERAVVVLVVKYKQVPESTQTQTHAERETVLCKDQIYYIFFSSPLVCWALCSINCDYEFCAIQN